MESLIIIASLAMKGFSALVERFTDAFPRIIRRRDVERKIKELEKERYKYYFHINAIYRKSHDRYKWHMKRQLLKTKNGSFNESFKDWAIETYRYDRELDAETKEDLKLALQAEQALQERIEAKEKNKNETVVNLFLLNEKNKLLKTKSISVLILTISTLSIVFLNLPNWTLLVGAIVFILAELKDQIISYRVSRGYFGTTTYEAIQLIKFIRDNSDKFDSDGDSDGRRKILNPEKLETNAATETDKGWQHV